MALMFDGWALRARNGGFLSASRSEGEMADFWVEPKPMATLSPKNRAERKFVLHSKLKSAELQAKHWNDRVEEKRLPEDWKVEPVKVLTGFVVRRGKRDTQFEELCDEMGIADDLVWRRNVFAEMHAAGGTNAEEGSWADGYDRGVDECVLRLNDVPCADPKPDKKGTK